MAVTDANTGKTLATPTIGDSPDAAGYDAKHKLAFSSNGDGTLTVVDATQQGSTSPAVSTSISLDTPSVAHRLADH